MERGAGTGPVWRIPAGRFVCNQQVSCVMITVSVGDREQQLAAEMTGLLRWGGTSVPGTFLLVSELRPLLPRHAGGSWRPAPLGVEVRAMVCALGVLVAIGPGSKGGCSGTFRTGNLGSPLRAKPQEGKALESSAHRTEEAPWPRAALCFV